MAKRTNREGVLKDNYGGNNWREILVDLKPDKATGKTIRRLRLIGDPIEYWEAQPRKRKDDGTKDTYACAFPDADINRSFTRICEDDPTKDEWTKMGYTKIKRFAINCIDRDDGKVKVLAKGSSIFKVFYKNEEENVSENKRIEAEGLDDELSWTQIGGYEAPDVKITASANKEAIGGVEYNVFIGNKAKAITDEEIEKLRAIGQPSPSELKALMEANPGVPDWAFFGYDLEELYKPTPPRSSAPVEQPTPVAELNVSGVDDETEEDEDFAPKPPKATEENDEDFSVEETPADEEDKPAKDSKKKKNVEW